jgi:hypothetical protein
LSVTKSNFCVLSGWQKFNTSKFLPSFIILFRHFEKKIQNFLNVRLKWSCESQNRFHLIVFKKWMSYSILLHYLHNFVFNFMVIMTLLVPYLRMRKKKNRFFHENKVIDNQSEFVCFFKGPVLSLKKSCFAFAK